uniref:Uncharacterized protein n=1 Tax=Lygus hesperus TaxID=30085 RepID=A0A0A9X270_LYGHE
MIALARPPLTLSSTNESLLISAIRDATVDDDWENAKKLIIKIVGAEAPHICSMYTVYAITKRCCMSNVADDREVFMHALNACIFDAGVLSRGLAWFLTYAIA